MGGVVQRRRPNGAGIIRRSESKRQRVAETSIGTRCAEKASSLWTAMARHRRRKVGAGCLPDPGAGARPQEATASRRQDPCSMTREADRVPRRFVPEEGLVAVRRMCNGVMLRCMSRRVPATPTKGPDIWRKGKQLPKLRIERYTDAAHLIEVLGQWLNTVQTDVVTWSHSVQVANQSTAMISAKTPAEGVLAGFPPTRVAGLRILESVQILEKATRAEFVEAPL